MRAYCLLIMLTSLLSFSSIAQIKIVNPSFEDQPSDAMVPKGWLPCEKGTTPDIFPGFWGEYKPAADGNTYVGLITREDGTFEAIGQRFSQAIVKNECYELSFKSAHGGLYAGYNLPIKLKIYLSKEKCGTDQVIFTSLPINHTSWRKETINFTTKDSYNYIRIEASYPSSRSTTKGNVFLDQMSHITKCKRV
jgi:hypothetical protein